MSYDAWGRRRNADGSDDTGPQWGSLKNAQDHSGYTGHEHLDQLGLVNMNARMYDPLLGRHTSADPTVPDPTNVQAFNRYSYVLNNALVFTDPTGLEAEHVNRTSDSICGGRPECAVYIAPSGEDATQTEGHHMGVAITEYLHATPLGQKDPAAASQLNSGAPPASQQESSTDPGPEIRRINRHFETALAAGDVATMQALYDKYVALKGDDPSSAPNVVRMGVAIMGAQARQGNYDLSSLAPMASAALGSGMLGAGLPGPNSGAGPTVSRITPGSLPSAAEAAALNTLKHIDAGTKPLGDLAKKWGTQFKNWAGDLPGGQGTASPYREYRVAPPAGTPGAGPNRIVVNGKTGEVYYTWTHYGDTAQPAFVKIR
nr:RHS repeat-associated core domain-containing protein [Rhizobacter sp. SG703]